ncbi:unnamed protein product [Rotaria sp. Silwood2]|nr:unnamed protein product [Rotaria sp. Silwood2]CAF2857776.1 unnamed protein product [Rotaria sp. Silwood2]CAF3295409.1 unnamed protein product [Rotaria sp. Silwood2]CAF4431963.1 unnamed protein product [Rotaria sp. Silwood2]CAF4482535.1 unnamed protein product [Rotaria sp. Silwood2]
MQSTFEKLSDEILMIIFSYLDNIYSIFRTFLGLNQRINNILLDKRLHLLINFLCINVDPEIIYSYYNSLEVQQVTQTLMLLNGTTNNNEIVQCLESLVCFHIKNQYTRLDKEFQLNRDNFQSIRKQLSNSEIQNVDNELKIAFNKLEHTSNTIQQIHTLLYIRGAHLECNEDQMRSFDLVRAINCQMLIYYKSTLYHSRKKFYHLISIFKGFIISNPNLLKIFYYLGYGFNVVHCLLFTIFQRRFIYSNQLCTTNLYYYQSLVELVLLSIRTIVNDGSWSESYFFEILNIIKLNKESMNSTSDIIFRTTEIELLKILLDQSNVHMAIPWNENTNDSFTRALNHLIKNDCMNIVRMMYRHNQFLRYFLQETDYIEKNINIMLGHYKRKQLLNQLLDEKPLNVCFTRREFLFQLLNKKQFQILKKIIRLSITVLNELDEDGNDFLLYLCLKVLGCRHRFIQYLIKIGCNIQRKNSFDQSFFDVIELEQNRKLRTKLFECEVISIDKLTGKINIS